MIHFKPFLFIFVFLLLAGCVNSTDTAVVRNLELSKNL
ncbi:hypothetical protein EDD64_13239 [Effusibacillus lacus]|nr:hypothetical protein EDD64_13239 [Effusibacillus lacus]